ncbi:hypothetical protein CCMA1212_000088 [Trichoderma ghanense]|uniref:Uncharacterized protein n=1 Tax=Trichoderma ghanense TaxID=65468 RepID=A0ABY2HH32_9HYPO
MQALGREFWIGLEAELHPGPCLLAHIYLAQVLVLALALADLQRLALLKDGGFSGLCTGASALQLASAMDTAVAALDQRPVIHP